MSETLTAPVATETTQTPQVTAAPTATPTPTPVPTGTAQDEARRLLYEKHYGGTPAGTTETPTTAVTSETSAAQAVAATPSANEASLPAEYLQAMQAMQAEMVALRAQLTPKAPAPDPNAEPSWVSLLREGKVTEAEAALAASIATKLQSSTVEEAVARSREMSRAESNIEEFVRDLKTANPELVPLEKLIASEAQERLAVLQSQGKIKSTDDAVREYKRAVIDATESARKIAQTLRGAGKSEAMVRNREVLSASTVSPQGVDQTRTQQSNDGTPAQPETTDDYFAKRRALETSRRGLAV